MFFLGTHDNGVDAKARVSVPAEFRQVVRAEALDGVYCWPSFMGGYLEGCGASLMGRVHKALESMNPFDEAADAFSQAILGESRLLKFDATGRITLPKDFIDHAGLDERCVFNGRGDRFRIWAPQAYEAHRLEARRIARDNPHKFPSLPSANGHGGNGSNGEMRP